MVTKQRRRRRRPHVAHAIRLCRSVFGSIEPSSNRRRRSRRTAATRVAAAALAVSFVLIIITTTTITRRGRGRGGGCVWFSHDHHRVEICFFCAFLVCSKTKGKKKRSIIERKKNTYSTLSDRSLSLYRSLVLKIDFLSSSLFLSFDRAVLKHVSAETSTPLLSLYIFHL